MEPSSTPSVEESDEGTMEGIEAINGEQDEAGSGAWAMATGRKRNHPIKSRHIQENIKRQLH